MNFSKDMQAKIDALIRNGRGDASRQVLASIAKKKLLRSELLPFCQMARRVDCAMLALTKLVPVIRPGGELSTFATPSELAEYAICLSKIGAYEEALDLIKDIDPRHHPEIHMARTFALIAQWNHAAAIPGLQEYLGSSELTAYERLVVESNLALALVHERRFAVAEPLLAELLEATKAEEFRFLHGKITALWAQSAIMQKDWGTAERYLGSAEANLSEMGGIDKLLIEKWRAVLDVIRRKADKISLKELREVRKKGENMGHWETVRQCDYFEAVHARNEKLFLHLYFGTPYHLFRARLVSDFGKGIEIPNEFDWVFGEELSRKAVDSRAGSYEGQTVFKNGQLLHRLFLTLCGDFYRPFRVAPLHFRLYPGEYFNPKSSSEKVLFAIKALRRQLQVKRVPLSIETKDVTFRLVAKAPLKIKVSLEDPIPKKESVYLSLLVKSFNERGFSIQEAAKVLQSSPRTANRVMKDLIEQEAVELTGRGRATLYKIKRAA